MTLLASVGGWRRAAVHGGDDRRRCDGCWMLLSLRWRVWSR